MLIHPKLPWYTHMSDRPATPRAVPTDRLPDEVRRRVAVSSWFGQDGDGVHLCARFCDYRVDLSYAARTGSLSSNGCDLAQLFGYAVDDLQNVALLLHRMDWIHKQSAAEAIDPTLSSMYLALDIELFQVELRSAMDYCASSIEAVASKRGQAPTSFRDLQKWVQEPRAVSLLGEALVDLVKGAGWFPGARGIRDAILHQGGRALVFPSKTSILFQVYDSALKNLIVDKHVMHNENVVDFGMYSAILLSEFLLFMEGLAGALSPRCPAPGPLGEVRTRTYNVGFEPFLAALGAYADAARFGRADQPK